MAYLLAFMMPIAAFIVMFGCIVWWRKRCQHPINDRLCVHLKDTNFSYCFLCDKYFPDTPWLCSDTGKPHKK